MANEGHRFPLPCLRCGKPATNRHHRKRKSQGGDDSPENVIDLCGSGTTGCHGWVHANPAQAYEQGWLVKSWQNPAEVPILTEGAVLEEPSRVTSRVVDGPTVVPSTSAPSVSPGETCQLCKRRVPHPKKSTSPTTKPLAYRAPLDEYDAHLEAIDTVADILGIKANKYHRFTTINYALAVVLQGARLTETGE